MVAGQQSKGVYSEPLLKGVQMSNIQEVWVGQDPPVTLGEEVMVLEVMDGGPTIGGVVGFGMVAEMVP